MQSKKIKIAYLCDYDAKDFRIFSGITSYTADILEKQEEFEIHYIDHIEKSRNYFTLILGAIYSRFLRLFGKEYNCRWTLGTAKRYSKEVEKQLPKDTDVIFNMATAMALTYLKTDCKVVGYYESPIVNMINYYSFFSNLVKSSVKNFTIIEKKAFENSDLLIFSTDWAANNAKKTYNFDPARIKVIPWGPSMKTEYSDTEIKNIIDKRPTDKCNLLFVGVDWERKGCDTALEIAKELHSQNINVHLDIVGIREVPVPLPDYITSHGFVSKKTEEGINKLIELFQKAHFFVLPTRADCAPVVLSEASSFAVPSVATKTGGVDCVVRDNVNGMTFALSDPPKKYADYIATIFNNREEYEKLCLSVFNDYKTRLNWDVAGKKLAEAIKAIL